MHNVTVEGTKAPRRPKGATAPDVAIPQLKVLFFEMGGLILSKSLTAGPFSRHRLQSTDDQLRRESDLRHQAGQVRRESLRKFQADAQTMLGQAVHRQKLIFDSMHTRLAAAEHQIAAIGRRTVHLVAQRNDLQHRFAKDEKSVEYLANSLALMTDKPALREETGANCSTTRRASPIGAGGR
jgi:hypothetical protein